MPIPNPADILKRHLDAASDNPSLARAELLNLANRFIELLEALNQASGIPTLNADAKIKADQLFGLDAALRLFSNSAGERTLEHTNQLLTPANVVAATGEAITHVEVDSKGHVRRVSKGAISQLEGPFYTRWVQLYARRFTGDDAYFAFGRPANTDYRSVTTVLETDDYLTLKYSLPTNALGNVETRNQPDSITGASDTELAAFEGRLIYYLVT